MITKLSPLGTYFSLVKGFIAIGVLYSPKNFKNAGWLFGLFTMVASFSLTLICLIRLIQARNALGGGSFSEIAQRSLGMWGKIIADILMCMQQIGFTIGMIYFVIQSLKEVYDQAANSSTDPIWYGKISFLSLY